MEAVENKKSNLEELSKEELVKKCKGLLALAQKAKSAKEHLQEDNNKLRKELSAKTDEATTEVLEKLTEEKLQLVTQVEDLKLKNTKLDETVATLENENISYKRQIKRLTDENEQLISDLSSLEGQITELNSLGVQQRQQLLELEKTNGRSLKVLQDKLSSSLEEVKKLNDNLKTKEKEISELSQELRAVKIIKSSPASESCNKHCDSICSSKENEELKRKNEKLREKVSLYHSKLKKFALTIKEIKEEKVQVILSFKAYTNQIIVWKQQLSAASENLTTLVNALEKDNAKLKEEIANQLEREKLSDELRTKLNECETLKGVKEKENCDLQNKLKELQEEIINLKCKEDKERENGELQLRLKEANEDLESCKDKIAELQEEINCVKVEKDDKERESGELKIKLKELEEVNEDLMSSKVKIAELQEEISNQKCKEDEERENGELHLRLKELEEANKDLESCKGKIAELQEKINCVKVEKDDKERENGELKIKLKELEEANEDLVSSKAKIAELEEAINHVKLEKDDRERESSELKTKLKEYEEAKEDLVSFKAKVAELQEEINLVILEKDDRVRESGELKIKIKELEEDLVSFKAKISELQEEINYVKVEKDDKDRESSKLKIKLKELEEANEDLVSSKAKVAELQEEIKKLNGALKHSVDTDKQLAEMSSEEIMRLSENNKDLEKLVEVLQNELGKLKNVDTMDSSFQTEDTFQNSEENSVDLKRENSEMLHEMNQMNQALKERGEIISKLEAHCDEIKKKLQVYETQANKNVDFISEKEETIKSLSEEIVSLKNQDKDISEVAQLKAEIEALKEKLDTTTSGYADSEAMSTSTISRSEEANRLKDLEGSWEERYGKLRSLAVKLKGKIREQTTAIAELQGDKEELQKKLTQSVQTVQTLHNQMDKLKDDLEATQEENKQFSTKLGCIAEAISKDKQQLVQNEEIIAKLKQDVEKLNLEKQGVDAWKKQVGAKVQLLRKDLEAKGVTIRELESKLTKQQLDLDAKEKQLKLEQEGHKQTKLQLDQLASECKKNSVLNLEMQDYERSAKELSQKLDKQKQDLGNLQAQLDVQKTTAQALREQNKVLEERLEQEEKNGSDSTREVEACKTTIRNLEEALQQKEDKHAELTKQLEFCRSENEELSTELSKIIKDHQKSIQSIKSERDQLRNQILGLQQTLRDTQDLLALKQDELQSTKGDYDSYKVRAQSVLKKSQNRDLGLEEKLREDLATVRAQNGHLKEELAETERQLAKLKDVNEEVKTERGVLERKCKDLEGEVVELQAYGQQLTAKLRQAVAEHAETIRNLKIHAETLSQCYRQQLSEQEVRHNREIVELQSRLDKAPSPEETTPVHPAMPREEGEGSESVESGTPTASLHPIPLERLLDSKSDDEVIRLKKLNAEQESKLTHLTDLLSDTEQDLAKHVQMNKLLKEEIRRQQRSVEREKHAENLEYLKNVVFKFVTLNSGDERTRLVPVLNTILKLSPEETQKLTMVAKGEPVLKAWANYLPMWPSPNKPQ